MSGSWLTAADGTRPKPDTSGAVSAVAGSPKYHYTAPRRKGRLGVSSPGPSGNGSSVHALRMSPTTNEGRCQAPGVRPCGSQTDEPLRSNIDSGDRSCPIPTPRSTTWSSPAPVWSAFFLACELRLAGVSVIVLEQAESPSSPLKQLPFGVRGLSSPTLEAFHRRGLLDAVSALQPAKAPAGAHWMQQTRRPAGHFAGIQFFEEDVDASRWPYRLPSPAGFSMAVDLQSLETLLADRANALGVEIRRGHAVDGLDLSDDEVTVRAGGERFGGRWLVGCDGGRSAVRKLAGFTFVGTDPEFTGYSVEVALADPDMLPVGRHYTPNGMFTYVRPGTVAMVDFDGGAFHRTRPITPRTCAVGPAPRHRPRSHCDGASAGHDPGRIAPIRQPTTAEGGCC